MKKENTKQPKSKRITFQEITLLKNQLRDGDYPIIADVTDYSPEYVRSCMNNRRKNILILTVAKLLIDNRDKFMSSMKEMAKLIREGNFSVTE